MSLKTDALLWKARGGMRPWWRIPEDSEPEFQLDLVSRRGGLVSERGVGDAPRQFAHGAGECRDLGGVFGGGDLLWAAGEAVLGAGEWATAAGVGVPVRRLQEVPARSPTEPELYPCSPCRNLADFSLCGEGPAKNLPPARQPSRLRGRGSIRGTPREMMVLRG